MPDLIQTVTETFQPGGNAEFGAGGPTVSGYWTYQWDVTTNSLVANQTISGNIVVTGASGTTTFTTATVGFAGGASMGNVAEILWSTGTSTGGAGYHRFYMDWGASNTPSADEAPASLWTGNQSGNRNGVNEAQYTSIQNAGNQQFELNTDGGTGGVLTPVITCFARGTQILTSKGEVKVETLQPGDLIVTAGGVQKPVRWLGRSTIVGRFADRLRAAPILIKAGALGAGIPARDLRVSPGHALYLGGILVQAGALVNGRTIIQETKLPERFTYYHVELATHELLISEGAASESFVDNVDRCSFDNWAEHETLGRDAPITEMPLPRAKAHRQVPAAIRGEIFARAALMEPLANAA